MRACPELLVSSLILGLSMWRMKQGGHMNIKKCVVAYFSPTNSTKKPSGRFCKRWFANHWRSSLCREISYYDNHYI